MKHKTQRLIICVGLAALSLTPGCALLDAVMRLGNAPEHCSVESGTGDVWLEFFGRCTFDNPFDDLG